MTFRPSVAVLNKKGIPNPGNPDDRDIKGLEAFFALFEGDNAISRQHLSSFTSMHNGKGFPNASVVRTLYSWVEDNPSLLLKTMSRLFNGQGTPPVEPLKMYQQWLQRYTEPGDNDDDSGSETDDDDMKISIKLVALYLVNQGKPGVELGGLPEFSKPVSQQTV